MKGDHQRLMTAVRSLIMEGQPFTTPVVARKIGRSERAVNRLLREIAEAGLVRVQRRRAANAFVHIVTIVETGQTTCHPNGAMSALDDICIAARAEYEEWRARSGWSHTQVAISARFAVSASFGEQALVWFAAGRGLRYQSITELRRFMARYPDPGPYDNWRGTIAREISAATFARQEEIVRRAQAVQAERERQRREWLEREYRGQGRHPSASRSDDRLDAATIAALSGGTMTGGLRA